MNASRSAGPHCGKRLSKSPPIASRAPDPSVAASQIDQWEPEFDSNAIVRPSGDHAGFTFWFGPKNTYLPRSEPSVATTEMNELPKLSEDEIAISSPSGDHTGPVVSYDGWWMPPATWTTCRPLASATSSASPSR